MRNGRGFARIATGLVLIVLASSPQGAANTQSASQEDFILGFAIGLTGPYIAYDGEGLKTAQIAVDEINKQGGLLGRKLKIISADNKSQVTLSATAGLEVISKGAQMVVVSADFDLGGPAAAQAQSRGMVSFSLGAGSSKFGPLGIGDKSFTIGMAAAEEGPGLAEWAYNKKKWRSVFIMHMVVNSFNTEFCTTFEARFRELAGAKSIIGRANFKADDPSYATQITALRSAATRRQPDVILNCSFPPGGSKMYRAIRSAGFQQPLLNQQGMSGDFWKNAIPRLSNEFHNELFSIYGDDPDPKVNDLVKQFRRRTGKNFLTSYGLSGYPLIRVWADAVRKARTFDGAKVAAVLESFRAHPTSVGPWTFTQKYHINLKRKMRLMQIQNGKTSFVQTLVPKKLVLPKT